MFSSDLAKSGFRDFNHGKVNGSVKIDNLIFPIEGAFATVEKNARDSYFGKQKISIQLFTDKITQRQLSRFSYATSKLFDSKVKEPYKTSTARFDIYLDENNAPSYESISLYPNRHSGDSLLIGSPLDNIKDKNLSINLAKNELSFEYKGTLSFSEKQENNSTWDIEITIPVFEQGCEK